MIRNRIVPPPPGDWDCWEDLMHQALTEADQAALLGEVPVGGVLVSSRGEVLARAGNRMKTDTDVTAHAEMLLIREASRAMSNYRLLGCVAVVTLEPCLMCLGALAHARVAGVVFGARDPKAGAVTSQLEGFALPFLNHAVWHMGGICERECAARLQAFFSSRR